MTRYMQDLIVRFTHAVENETQVGNDENASEFRWLKAKARRSERRARLVDAIEKLEGKI